MDALALLAFRSVCTSGQVLCEMCTPCVLNALFSLVFFFPQTLQNNINSQTPKAKPISHESFFGLMSVKLAGSFWEEAC